MTTQKTGEGRYEILAGPAASGQRLDAFLAQQELRDGLTRSMLQQLIRTELVMVNGKARKAGYRLQAGDLIGIELPPPAPAALEPENIDFPVLFEDRDLAVIAKPPGIAVHPACGNPTGTLVHGLLFHCDHLSGISGEQRPGIVHRLDKDTSGVMVIAKNDRAHQALSRQFKDREVEKVYHALVEGRMGAPAGSIDQPIGRHPVHRKKMAVLESGREAVTRWRVLEEFPFHALLEVKPRTGRTHQIRVHLAFLGHPIVGDHVYGKKGGQGVAAPRQCLHASRLAFVHPATGRRLAFESPLWKDVEEIVNQLRQAGRPR